MRGYRKLMAEWVDRAHQNLNLEDTPGSRVFAGFMLVLFVSFFVGGVVLLLRSILIADSLAIVVMLAIIPSVLSFLLVLSRDNPE